IHEIQKPTAAPKDTPPVPLKTLAEEKAGALDPQDRAKTAGERMREHHAATWPVAEDRKLVGMIDEENPDWQLGGHGHDPKTFKVGEIMNRDAIFCYEDEDCARAQKLMEDHGMRHIPVVDRQMRVIGLLSREEVVKKAETS